VTQTKDFLTGAALRLILEDVHSGDDVRRRDGQERAVRLSAGLLNQWAQAETRRHSAQHIHIDLDEMRSLLIVNLLEALDRMDPEKVGSSGTNYLYSLLITNARREVHRNYGEVRFPSEFMEQARRVEAIEARLMGELGRQPSDTEIIAASMERVGRTRMGPRGLNDARETRAPVTEAFLARYREHRVYLDVAPLPDGDHLFGSAHVSAAEPDTTVTLEQVWERAADLSHLSDKARLIVWAMNGLGEHPHPRPAAEVSKEFDVTLSECRRVIRAWFSLCRTPNSGFHEALHELSDDEREELALADVMTRLGPFDPDSRPDVPPVLSAA
jgi:hypothetical protein